VTFLHCALPSRPSSALQYLGFQRQWPGRLISSGLMPNNMKNAVFWDVTPCASCKNDVSEERIIPITRVERISELATLAVTCSIIIIIIPLP
jgi:hypothetical protein